MPNYAHVLTLDALRRFAVTRSLFAPTILPAPKRVRGYYALPLLWRDQVIGWGNLAVVDGKLNADLGYVAGAAPRDKGFKQALDEELERMRVFLG